MQTNSLEITLDPSFSLTPPIQPSPNPKNLVDPSSSLLAINKKSPSYTTIISFYYCNGYLTSALTALKSDPLKMQILLH